MHARLKHMRAHTHTYILYTHIHVHAHPTQYFAADHLQMLPLRFDAANGPLLRTFTYLLTFPTQTQHINEIHLIKFILNVAL